MEHVGKIIAQATERASRRGRVPTVSAVLPDGALLEMVFDPTREVSAFALSRDGGWELIQDYLLPDGRRLVPLSPRNNLIEHGVVRFARGPQEYGTELQLAASVRGFIHRYVDLSSRFERIATSYVLLSWLFDTFNELPYLRVRGEPGSGKTRFLLTVGALCCKSILASGASTVSPIFRILDLVRGTLVIDESDFRVSDERAEVVKILNNGNVRGFPVLRTDVTPGSKEYDPRAYHVFGPKLIATRGFFDDPALESRFLTERMEVGQLRRDVPINLPREHDTEALELRNQLLLFRFRNFGKTRNLVDLADRRLEPRLAQIFAPLLAVTEDVETRADLRDLARQYEEEMVADRGSGVEADILEVVRELWNTSPTSPSMKAISIRLIERHGIEYQHMTAKRIGWHLRRKLGLTTVRSEGVYVVAPGEGKKLDRLYERYGVVNESKAPSLEANP